MLLNIPRAQDRWSMNSAIKDYDDNRSEVARCTLNCSIFDPWDTKGHNGAKSSWGVDGLVYIHRGESTFDPHKVTLLWTDDYMTEYGKRLIEILRKIHLQVSVRLPKPSEEAIHPFQRGDYVPIKSLENYSLSPRWKGPYQVLLATRMAVKVKSKTE